MISDCFWPENKSLILAILKKVSLADFQVSVASLHPNVLGGTKPHLASNLPPSPTTTSTPTYKGGVGWLYEVMFPPLPHRLPPQFTRWGELLGRQGCPL